MGVAVVFTAIGGVYIYMRECYEAAERLEKAPAEREEPRRLRKVA